MGWTIGEVARRTGVPASTLRFWEQAGLLPVPERISGRRDYRPAALDAIALIQLGQAAGLKIADIRVLVADADSSLTPAARWAAVAAPRARELDERITTLTAARRTLDALLACSCAALSECASHMASPNA